MTAKLDGLLRKHGLARVAKSLIQRAAPCIEVSDKKSSAFSRLGGAPDLPKDIAWPVFEGFPLSFIAQIDVSGLPRDATLPARGALFFFYDMRSWGYDPKHRGSGAVIYDPRKPEAGKPRDVLVGPRSPEFQVLPPKPVGFKPALSLPSSWSFPEWKTLEEEQMEAYHDLQKEVGGPHRMFGHPHRVQGEMTLECQLVTHGLYCGDASGYEDPRAKTLKKGVKEWKLLLQVDGESAGVEFGDAGLIYYWIREADLSAKRFEKTWTILQCY